MGQIGGALPPLLLHHTLFHTPPSPEDSRRHLGRSPLTDAGSGGKSWLGAQGWVLSSSGCWGKSTALEPGTAAGMWVWAPPSDSDLRHGISCL